MNALTITDACTACGMCIVTCPEQALAPAPKKPALDARRCTMCFACIEVCPRDAVREVAA